MDRVVFTVHGQLKGKGRPRFTRFGSHVYTPKETSEYEKQIKKEYHKVTRRMFDEAISIKIIAFRSIPKNDSKKLTRQKGDNLILPTTKPDVDNIIKVVLDGLNKIAYADDKQVVSCAVVKQYTSAEERITVIIEERGFKNRSKALSEEELKEWKKNL